MDIDFESRDSENDFLLDGPDTPNCILCTNDVMILFVFRSADIIELIHISLICLYGRAGKGGIMGEPLITHLQDDFILVSRKNCV